ncbi:uncharacterized protein I303_104659 [Kwoniella dejecticola CBS 10117]|uniref:Origin recognition complex subunit 3 winged helix C-terminal domain-containing protein n=1 Tax=Kwoniella dejecticola CBS 10117 TaxID=1296121 RepID=A0A1A6A4P6_9TREE|nr:uncharacterized protein I303_04361 [Kwoniella dejecticola CBS 10117]OBR85034.1 hypothetical protein I303_04361 [Kwoniella dejecticola CBS 10117]
MEEDKYQSLSKGVFVIPFQPDTESESEAGPSRPPRRPLERFYDAAYQHYEGAYIDYAIQKASEQMDDIQDWLDRCSNSSSTLSAMSKSLLKFKNPIYRLEVGLLQNTSISASIVPELHTLGTVCTIQGRDINDISSAMRSISMGFVEESAVAWNNKSGRTGIEELEIWYTSKKNKSALLVYIQDAQMLPAAAMGELMYILSLHPALPIRLLLSVPSITHFLSSWTPIELSSIALSILPTNTSKKNTGVEAILRASNDAPLRLSEDLIDELRSEEARSGGGPALVLKAIKWLLLHHSTNSALSRIAASPDPSQLKKVQALINARLEHDSKLDLPGQELFQIDTNKDLSSVLHPAPRTSILHALSNPEDYISIGAGTEAQKPNGRSSSPTPDTSADKRTQPKDTPRASKRKRTGTADDPAGPGEENVEKYSGSSRGEELTELKTLFELWKNAGKSVNLWDWLDGFSGMMDDSKNETDRLEATKDDGVSTSVADDARKSEGIAEAEADEQRSGLDEENEARLHAIFIRFVEEARMLGLIRARGKGRKADEVVKGVGLV